METKNLTKEYNRPVGWKPNIVRSIVTEPYCWPGGYAKVGVCTDGGLLCPDCIEAQYDSVYRSTFYDYRDGWGIEAVGAIGVNLDPDEDTMFCDHCNKDLCSL